MANEDYIGVGTALLINGEAGADYAWSVEGLANSAGRVSAQIDLGAAPRPYLYAWSCEVQFQATPTQYAGLDLYFGTAPDNDSTQIDADIGSSDAALGDADQRYNLEYIDSVISENAAASEKCVRSGTIYVPRRYLSLVAYNASGATVNATDSNFVFRLQPLYKQIQ
jgi:hypothetical protein